MPDLRRAVRHLHQRTHRSARVGKTCDLAFGYQGGLNAWRKFEPDKFTDAEVETFKTEWRSAHPEDRASSGTTSIVRPCLRCASAARSSAAAASI